MFPMSVGATYETVLTPDRVEALLSRLEAELAREGATYIHRLDNKITFRGGSFRSPLPYRTDGDQRGEIEITCGPPVRVRYRLSCMRMFLVCGALAFVVVAAAVWFRRPWPYLVPGALWLLMCVLHYLTAWIRIRAFVKRVVEELG